MLMPQERKPGNYLAFFSNFRHLEWVADDLCQSFPYLKQWRQARHRPEADRQAFIRFFVANGIGIGFAVLGGAFGEGVDLPGTSLSARSSPRSVCRRSIQSTRRTASLLSEFGRATNARTPLKVFEKLFKPVAVSCEH